MSSWLISGILIKKEESIGLNLIVEECQWPIYFEYSINLRRVVQQGNQRD
jgi:hypothetical protein